MLPSSCTPIIVADSGFKTPFYRYIEETHHWHWVGRIRSRDHLKTGKDNENQWFSANSSHEKMTGRAKKIDIVQWTRKNSLSAFIVLIRKSKKQHHSLTYKGKKRQSKKEVTIQGVAYSPDG